MGGICGVYGDKELHEKLPLTVLEHRGPDGRGMVQGGQYKFGHTRLAIIDSMYGKQPMYNEDESLCLTFNGEIYNHLELREGLKRRHTFRTNCNTEVILHLYEEEGAFGLSKLDGMFALAIATPDGLVLARDPLGIKPLYIYEDENIVYFASELKAFQDKHRGMIREFPPGNIYQGGTQRWDAYYTLRTSYLENMTREECLQGIRERLEKAVIKRLVSDVPLGSFLSGGLDSSLISALAKKYKDELHTFSVSMEDSNDRHFAEIASKYIGSVHHEYILSRREMWQAVPEVIYYLESFDQYLVRSAVANYFLAKCAAQEVKVVLTGEGADELFAGYAYLERFGDVQELHGELLEITGELYRTGLQRVDRMTMAHGLQARVPFLDREVVDWALAIPPWYKREPATGQTKWCLREAYKTENILPSEVIGRGKEKFSEGSGVARILAALAAEKVSEDEFAREIAQGAPLRSREECYYYKIFRSSFGDGHTIDLVGRSKS